MIQLKNLLLGAIAFIIVHIVILETWQTWFHGGGGHAAWFLNSEPSVVFTAIVFAVINFAAVLASGERRGDAVMLVVLNVAVGAVVAMAVALFRLPGGPGTIFPIVIVTGFALFAAAGAVGGAAGWAICAARPGGSTSSR
jgi:hypothetical protein